MNPKHFRTVIPTTPVPRGAASRPANPPATAFNTPYKQKLASSVNKPWGSFLKKTMDPMLEDEIDNSHLPNVPDLLPILFPDNCLPLPLSQIWAKLSTGDDAIYLDSKWVGCPDLTVPSLNGDVEAALVKFLQNFTVRVAKVVGLEPPTQKWTARYSNKGVDGAPNVRKPDILFANDGVQLKWDDVWLHGELTSKNSVSNTLQLLNGADFIFSRQDTHRFVLSLSFVAHDLQLFIFDRAGLVTTTAFGIHKDPKSFIRVLVGLMFINDRAFVGYDTSIVEKAGRRTIDVDGCEYEIVKTLFVRDVISGRGTVCWQARYQGHDFVIKDTWADDSQPLPEAEILQKAEGIEGVPKVVADVIVRNHSVEDSTAILRATVQGAEGTPFHSQLPLIETRTHRRLVITPFGLPLSHFANRRELISIFIDVVKAHRDLFEKAHILHRDISVNNLLIVPQATTSNSDDLAQLSQAAAALPDSLTTDHVSQPAAARTVPSGPRRGLLIDVDHALVVEPGEEVKRKIAVGYRTGTLPFMAVEVLYFGDELPEHEPRHDLESMLYVLIWLCLHYAGPGNVEHQNFDIYQTRLACWVQGDFAAIGASKGGTMRDPGMWEVSVLGAFAPYFGPMKAQCVSKWRDLLVNNDMTYDAVLGVLKEALDELPEREEWSRQDDPEGYGLELGRGEKRKRMDSDFASQFKEAQDEHVAKVRRGGDGHRIAASFPAVLATAEQRLHVSAAR